MNSKSFQRLAPQMPELQKSKKTAPKLSLVLIEGL